MSDTLGQTDMYFKMTLHEYGLYHGSDKATAHQYLDFYQTEIGNPRIIMEFGVKDGASMKMWREFYAGSLVVGLDINNPPCVEGCLIYEKDATKQSTVDMLTALIPQYDLIVDDASHMVTDQIDSLNLWWPYVKPGGHYIIEDIHTQYYDHYNPMKFWLANTLEALGITYKEFWRDPSDKSDSGTVILYK